VLELARSGAELKAAVVFHAGLDTPDPGEAPNIRAPVLALLGAEDPLVPPPMRAAFEAEMTAAAVDWRIVLYGGAAHGFTNPEAKPGARPGVAYHAPSDRRSWAAMLDLLAEVFQPADGARRP